MIWRMNRFLMPIRYRNLILTAIIILCYSCGSSNQSIETGDKYNFAPDRSEVEPVTLRANAIARSILHLLLHFTISEDHSPQSNSPRLQERLNALSSKIGSACGAALADPGGSFMEATDSSGHFPPESLASGHLFALGSFDRCLASTWEHAYCVVSLDVSWAVFGAAHSAEVQSFKRRVPLFRSMPGISYLQGWCLPSSCTPRDAKLITRMAVDLVTFRYNATIIEVLKIGERSGVNDFYESLSVDDVVCTYVRNEGGDRQTVPISIYDTESLAGDNVLNDTMSAIISTRRSDLVFGSSYFIVTFLVVIVAFVLDTLKYGSSSDVGGKGRMGKERPGTLLVPLLQFLESCLLCFSPSKNLAKLIGTGRSRISTTNACFNRNQRTSNGYRAVVGGDLGDIGEVRDSGNGRAKQKFEETTKPDDKSSQSVPSCQPRDNLAIFNGIRTLAMFHVIFAHTYVFALFYIRNLNDVLSVGGGLGSSVDNQFSVPTDPPFLFLYSAFFAVDTFLFVSGFLAAASSGTRLTPARGRLEPEEPPDRDTKLGSSAPKVGPERSLKPRVITVLGYLFYRLSRLTPVYASLIIFLINLAPYAGSGPFWPAPGQGGIDPTCRTHWWTNLLYVNNLIASDKMCAPWTWYLANDVQYHVLLAPALIMAFVSAKTTSVAKASAPILTLLGLSIAISAGVSYAHGFRSFAFLDDVKILNFFYDFYIKPYVRVGPFLIGLLLGCKTFFPKSKRRVEVPSPRVTTKCISWTLLATAITSIILGLCLVHVSWTSMEPFVVAFVNAIYRPVWALVLYTFVNRVLSGKGCIGRKIVSFLSAPSWIPLSNLTYSAYLIHPVVMQVVFRSMRTPIYFAHTTLFIYFLAFVIITYAISLLTYLAFEMPFINMAKLIILPR